MPDPALVLRLTGDARPERLEAWVRGLGRVPARARELHIAPDTLPGDLPAWCEDAGVRLAHEGAGSAGADVLVIARSDDLPTPGSLQRLVAITRRTAVPHDARILPCGDVTPGDDDQPDRAPSSCIAVPGSAIAAVASAGSADDAIASLTSGGIEVRRADVAAVFADGWPSTSTSGVPVGGTGHGASDGGPAADSTTSLHQLLGRAGMTPPDAVQAAPDEPFLTVVTRTQGTRPAMLEEALTCLAGQSSRDFELLVMCHRTPPDRAREVRELVGHMPAWLSERSRVVDVDRPGRASPLNDALALARGRYLAVLDDDDAVTSDWVATFAELESTSPGAVLRASVLRQDVEPLSDDGDVVPRQLGAAVPGWPREFVLVDHLWDNASPFMSLAFPRQVFADLGHRFDETLEAMEDWDYLLRAATLVGVTSSARLTSVYRTWTHTEGSRELHDEGVWEAAREAVASRVDALALVVPPGTMEEVRALHRELREERAEKFRFAALNEQAAADLRTVNDAVVALRERVAQLEERLARLRRRRQAT